MDDKKKRAVGVSIMAGLLCIGVVTGVSVTSSASPDVETETEVKETMTLTEKEYKSNGTFSVQDLKWSEDISKYNPRFADGMTSVTYKANGEYMETIVLSVGEEKRKYDVVVRVEGVVTTVPTTTITTTTKATEAPTTTQKSTTKSTEKATTKKTTKKATTATKKAVTTTKKKAVSTTKATTSSDETGGVPILSEGEWDAYCKQNDPNHPDNKPADTFEGW